LLFFRTELISRNAMGIRAHKCFASFSRLDTRMRLHVIREERQDMKRTCLHHHLESHVLIPSISLVASRVSSASTIFLWELSTHTEQFILWCIVFGDSRWKCERETQDLVWRWRRNFGIIIERKKEKRSLFVVSILSWMSSPTLFFACHCNQKRIEP
jgi:hypothetical protein